MTGLIRAVLAVVAVTTAGLILSLQTSVSWRVALLCLTLIPLAMLVAGIWQRRLKSYRVGTILMVFYVGFALTEMVARPGLRLLATLLLVAATSLIILLVVAIRQTVRQRPS